MSKRFSYVENIKDEYQDREWNKYHKLQEFTGGSTNAAYLERLKKSMERVIKNNLNKHQQELIRLYYFEDMKLVEIAELNGTSFQAVQQTIKRANKKIKQFLDCCV